MSGQLIVLFYFIMGVGYKDWPTHGRGLQRLANLWLHFILFYPGRGLQRLANSWLYFILFYIMGVGYKDWPTHGCILFYSIIWAWATKTGQLMGVFYFILSYIWAWATQTGQLQLLSIATSN